MDGRELRIGNTVYNNGEVMSIDFGDYISESHLYDPIPLTEEWLLKFGFIKCNSYWEHNIFEIAPLKSGWIYSINWNEYTCGNPFHYVHQLQNLYFALTGEELTIKE